MRRPCKELARYLESGAEALPDALQAHLRQCPACQRVWRMEQAYRRALQAARREPTPVCEVPWAQVQARLAGRAVTQRRPVFWRLTPAFGLGAAALIAFSIVWLTRSPKPEPTTTLSPPSVAQVAPQPAEPASKRVAQAMPLPADAGRLQLPAQATLLAERSSSRQQVQGTPDTPEIATGKAAVTVMDAPQPTDLELHAIPSAPAPEIATAAATPHHKATGAETPPTLTVPLEPANPPVQIASLPLNQLRLLENGDTYYLPFNYGTSSRKESDNHAMVGSF